MCFEVPKSTRYFGIKIAMFENIERGVQKQLMEGDFELEVKDMPLECIASPLTDKLLEQSHLQEMVEFPYDWFEEHHSKV